MPRGMINPSISAEEGLMLDTIVSEVVQNSQSLYSFTFNALFIIHEYIYSHSTTKFLFKKYIYSHLTTYFLFTKIFTHIYGCIYSHSTVYIRSHSQSKYWFNTVQYSFNIFCAPPLRCIHHFMLTIIRNCRARWMFKLDYSN